MRFFIPQGILKRVLIEFFGQATKSLWWMAWRQEAMKDVVSSDMLRGGANSL
jgi:hypothetical protein